MNDDLNKLKAGDVAYTIAKAGIGSIPIVGAAAAEIFGLVITPPLEKRRADWMNEIAARLKALEDKNEIDLASLKDNEQFIDAVLQATSFALKTSDDEKIKAFQNAIINTATGDAPDKIKSQIFLNQLDRLTSWHIKILDLIDNPRHWYERSKLKLPNYNMGGVSTIVMDAFSDMRHDEEFFHVIWNDLIAARFVKNINPNTTMTGNGMMEEKTTPFGKEFLEFIRESK